jgi:hypothetical protein
MITLNSPGLYLLGNEKQVQVSIEEFLLVLFHSPSSSSSGLVLEHSEDHSSDFLAEIKELYQKYSNLPDVDSALIKVKIFGTKPQNTHLVLALRNWLNRNQIAIIASDFGKVLYGPAIIDCKSGKVGIEGPSDQKNRITLLSTGTMRNRFKKQEAQSKILILSENDNTRILAKQAIEEEISWEAHCPKDLSLSSLKNVMSEIIFSAIIVSDDFNMEPTVLEYLLDHNKKCPSLVFGYLGAQLPVWATSNMKHLPPLEPYLIPRFKKIIRHCLSEVLFSKTSELMNFPQRRKA